MKKIVFPLLCFFLYSVPSFATIYTNKTPYTIAYSAYNAGQVNFQVDALQRNGDYSGFYVVGTYYYDHSVELFVVKPGYGSQLISSYNAPINAIHKYDWVYDGQTMNLYIDDQFQTPAHVGSVPFSSYTYSFDSTKIVYGNTVISGSTSVFSPPVPPFTTGGPCDPLFVATNALSLPLTLASGLVGLIVGVTAFAFYSKYSGPLSQDKKTGCI